MLSVRGFVMAMRFGLAILLMGSMAAFGQEAAQQPLPPAYRGVQVHIPGIYITPVPNAPFTAKVQIVSQEQLPDGTVRIRKTVNHIARQASGRIYNERRQLVPPQFQGEPRLLSAHIYDPTTRLSQFLNPMTHIDQEIVLKAPPAAPANSVPGRVAPKDPNLKEEELGEQALGPVMLRGIRRSRTVPATQSGTGQPVVIVDEYWYSPDLSIYMIIKHNDPRTGEQIVAVSEVERGEPDPVKFTVPANYKRADETPVE